MEYVIDRFEGRIAILEAENGETLGVERARLPREAVEGDVVLHRYGEFSVDKAETIRRRSQMRGKLDSLWEKESS